MPRSTPPNPLDNNSSDAIRALEVRFAERVASIEARLNSIERSVFERLATIESRMVTLSMPEQLAGMQRLLREQYAQFEWLANGMVRLREATQGFFMDIAPETPVDLGLPDVGAVVATMNGADKGAGLPPELQALLAGLMKQAG